MATGDTFGGPGLYNVNGDQTTDVRTLQFGERAGPSSTGVDYTAVKIENNYTTITTATTTVIKTGAGWLHTITILGGTGGAVTVYDNTAGSGTVIAPTFTAVTTTHVTLTFDVGFATGLTIVTAAATIMTVAWQ